MTRRAPEPYIAWRPCRDRSGVTLLELLLVLVILGLLSGVVGLAWRDAAWASAGVEESGHAAIDAARRAAVESGRPVTVEVDGEDGTVSVVALPDGRLVGGGEIGFDPLSGRRSRSTEGRARPDTAGGS